MRFPTLVFSPKFNAYLTIIKSHNFFFVCFYHVNLIKFVNRIVKRLNFENIWWLRFHEVKLIRVEYLNKIEKYKTVKTCLVPCRIFLCRDTLPLKIQFNNLEKTMTIQISRHFSPGFGLALVPPPPSLFRLANFSN